MRLNVARAAATIERPWCIRVDIPCLIARLAGDGVAVGFSADHLARTCDSA
jgi:hypothetical protein